ncbi:hypothetical protein OHB12_10015 [Nocardia sp. NBC_01730]|uniref:hypothetical protein n=1 Tax=Nocardia sp. NBC_01730 TaxID=2975998 RepID=UPI002E107BFF|nr:hypothetical protein OHB12_10015 [Nocardia sp. NBC_01730]
MTRTVPPVIPHRSEGLGQAVTHPGATARDMVELPLASMRRHRPDAARYSLRPVDTHGQIMDRELVAHGAGSRVTASAGVSAAE